MNLINNQVEQPKIFLIKFYLTEYKFDLRKKDTFDKFSNTTPINKQIKRHCN